MNREEAIETIRRCCPKVGDSQCDFESALRELIPELRESEDERIRKFLIDILSSGVWRTEWPFSPVDCVAYLEKQKEQKPEFPKPHKGDDNNPYDMRVSEAQEYAIKRGFGIPFNDGEVYVDERHLTQTIGNILRWADEHPKEQKPNIELIQRSWYMDGYIDGEFKREPRWNLKAGKGGPKYEENEKYGQPLEQKKWSEEDEDFINMLILHFNYLIDKGGDSVETYKSYREKLKSLRPKRVNVSDQTLQLLICYLYGCHDVAKRDWEKADCRRYISYLEDLDYTLKNRWKPSEEQMKALEQAKISAECGNFFTKDGLKSLYEQLKVL